MFEKLCGKNALENVIITTTMWDKVDEQIGVQREKELKGVYWKPMINQGSRALRYFNTYESAWAILDGIVGHNRHAVLLQREMVEMGRQLNDTDAGRALYSVLEQLVKRQQETLKEIQSERNRQADENLLKHLREEYDILQAQLQTTMVEMNTLKISVSKRLLRHIRLPIITWL